MGNICFLALQLSESIRGILNQYTNKMDCGPECSFMIKKITAKSICKSKSFILLCRNSDPNTHGLLFVQSPLVSVTHFTAGTQIGLLQHCCAGRPDTQQICVWCIYQKHIWGLLVACVMLNLQLNDPQVLPIPLILLHLL